MIRIPNESRIAGIANISNVSGIAYTLRLAKIENIFKKKARLTNLRRLVNVTDMSGISKTQFFKCKAIISSKANT
jgi:hypothetical protein